MAVMAMQQYQFYKLNQSLKAKYEIDEIADLGLKAKFNVAQMQQFLTDASLTGDDEAIKEASEQMQSLKKSLTTISKNLDPNDSLQTTIKAVLSSSEQWQNTGLEMVHAYTKKGKDAGDAIMKRKSTGFDDLAQSINGQIEALSTECNARSAKMRETVSQTQTEVNLYPSIMLMFAILGTIGTLAYVLKRISIVNEVSNTITGVGEAIKTIVCRVYSVSQELSRASTQLASAVQESAASIEEISAMAKKSAATAIDTESSAQQSASSAEQGKSAVSNVSNSMSHIHSSSEDLNKTVLDSNQQISEIKKVIEEVGLRTKVINDIVFQTKLLSFNASIEAARAGEHGKGFSVVAEEVGNLAQMSGNAAREITDLLEQSIGRVEQIVSATKDNVSQTMSASKNRVSEGIAAVKDCERVLNEIYGVSMNVVSSITEISSAIKEQSTGVGEISKALQEIDQATQLSHSSSQNCAQSADELARKTKDFEDASRRLYEIMNGSTLVPKFIWGDHYLLKVKAMDDEHLVLVEKMNALATAFEAHLPKSTHQALVLEKFEDFAAYTAEHFRDEEVFMKSIDYPDFIRHKGIHDHILAQAAAFGETVKNGSYDGIQFMDFLNDWLMRHIIGEDKKYSHHYHKNQPSRSRPVQDQLAA